MQGDGYSCPRSGGTVIIVGIVLLVAGIALWLLKRYIQSIPLPLLIVGLLVGCSTPPVVIDANIPVASQQHATSQATNAGDLTSTGGGTQVGGGNAVNLNGGGVIALVLGGLMVVMVGYLLAKGILNVSVNTAARIAAKKEGDPNET